MGCNGEIPSIILSHCAFLSPHPNIKLKEMVDLRLRLYMDLLEKESVGNKRKRISRQKRSKEEQEVSSGHL